MMKLSGILLVVALGIAQTQGQQCQECLPDNNVYCESTTTYYDCMGGVKIDGPFLCTAGTVCTNDTRICVRLDEVDLDIVNVCKDSASSGTCNNCQDTTIPYTCLSKTQAGRCVNGEVTRIINCGADEICAAEGLAKLNNICVPQCVATFADWEASCTNDLYTSSTILPPTTPDPNSFKTRCIQASAGKTTKYFYAYLTDSTCNSYVYCQRATTSSTNWDVTFSASCPATKQYFNTVSGTCQTTKPSSCTI